jgi:hypothetical protein
MYHGGAGGSRLAAGGSLVAAGGWPLAVADKQLEID